METILDLKTNNLLFKFHVKELYLLNYQQIYKTFYLILYILESLKKYTLCVRSN